MGSATRTARKARQKAQLLSFRQYAKYRGVSAQAISDAVRFGRIPTVQGRIDPVEADLAWDENTDAAKAPGGIGGRRKRGRVLKLSPDATWAEARTAREHMMALIAEIEYRERAGAVVSREDVEKIGFATARRARDLLLSIPDRLSSVLAGVTDAKECHRLIAAEIQRVCAELTATPARPRRRPRSRP